MFYDQNKHECRVYEIRPLICKTYPISDVPEKVGITIDVRCDYGRDIYKCILHYQRTGTENELFED